jgi:murein L,D-transpeptidase YafK
MQVYWPLALRARWLAAICFLIGSLIAICSARANEAAAEKPLPAAVEAAIIMHSIAPGAPIYLRVFKEESELEVWKARPNGRYALIKTFPVCNWGGTLGPKQTQGDLMSPEGFYNITPSAMKPDSKYHLAFNIGYPNALDRALGRTGGFIMVHGDCRSVGCFAMSDKLIEEIYAFVRDALAAGQSSIPIHVFPFRMTAENMKRFAGNPAHDTWGPLKQAYDDFAETRVPPKIGMCGKRYIVNSIAPVGMDPLAACPAMIGKRLAPLSPRKAKKLARTDPDFVAPGQKRKFEPKSAGFSDYLTSMLFGSSTPQQQPVAASASESKRPNPEKDAALGALRPILNQ